MKTSPAFCPPPFPSSPRQPSAGFDTFITPDITLWASGSPVPPASANLLKRNLTAKRTGHTRFTGNLSESRLNSSSQRETLDHGQAVRILYAAPIPTKVHTLIKASDCLCGASPAFPNLRVFQNLPAFLNLMSPRIQSRIFVIIDLPEFNRYHRRQRTGKRHGKLCTKAQSNSGLTPILPDLSRTAKWGLSIDHDIFVFPSIWEEPFGLTHIEAMASGLAVVSTG